MSEQREHVFYGGSLIGSIDCDCSSLGSLILKRLSENGKDEAFIDAISGESIRYDQLLECVLILSHRLRSCGIGKGSVVAIMSENSNKFPIAALGTICSGAVVLPLNPSYTETELNHILSLTNPQLIFASTKALHTLLSIHSQHPCIKQFISFDNCVINHKIILFDKFVEHTDSYPVTASDPVLLKDDVTLMVLSSGTTGFPKAVQLTHYNVMTVIAYMREDPRYTQLSVPIRLLGLLPFYHVYGFMLTLNVACNHYPMVVLPRFEPDLFLRSIQNHQITMANLVPPLMVFLAKHPAVDNYDLSSLRAILCGAAPLSKHIEDQVLKRLPHVQSVRTAYGMSETSLGVLSKVNDKAGSVGRVHKTSWVKIVDNSGNSLGPYEVGEICVKGPLVMKGYYRDAEATNQSIDEQGWLHSGDTGYFDDEGDFFIVDRIKDLIKYKGFQVAPAEIESVLLSHEAIRDAAVVGLPDDNCGELPVAFVVQTDKLSEDQIKQFVESKLSPQKHLRGGVYFVNEIPKTGSGKILRRELRKLLPKKTKAKL
ncbi:luciferin 4-monooxygenase-like [Malaya genurostris]|uniref:luciferin 4-monooxygenase-like n=1 Tax=Malaya genurostris TaxID=325434 RepID=UPI0026F38C8C|nr:luciferin 4-monooxygenase-like [Malaya genurostris]